MDLEKWDIPTLNRLVNLRNIERETFDFKGAEFKKLYEHLCAFANYPESGIIVLGVDPIKPQGVVIGHRKIGFDSDREDWIRNEINNQMGNVNPIPKVDIKILSDIDEGGRLYPVLKVEGDEVHKPYFLKVEGRQCLVRIGASSSPASRTTVLYLFSDIITKRNNVERLRGSAGFLKEALMYTCKNIRDINPADPFPIIGVDLTFLKNAALSSERFLTQNNLLGGHQNIHSLTGGLYSFIHDIERLNLLIRAYNMSRGYDTKFMIKKRMQFWEPEHDEYTQAIGFLNKIRINCDEFLSKV